MSIKKEMMVRTTSIGVLLTVCLLLGVLSFASALEPTGAQVSVQNSSTAPADFPGNHSALAGNVTEMNVFGYSTTFSWQGYYGNVTGVIQLADGSDRVMYNWTLASPQGEVYASVNSTIQWANIQCFNFTANGTYNSEAGNGGSTNLYGTNLSILEAMYNITWDDVDGVNETFSLLGATTHDNFYTAHKQFSEGECQNTRVYSPAGPVTNQFEEVLLYEPVTTSVVFASLLEEDVSGFDTRQHDFEMLVLEDGHSTDTASTLYYFYVEIN